MREGGGEYLCIELCHLLRDEVGLGSARERRERQRSWHVRDGTLGSPLFGRPLIVIVAVVSPAELLASERVVKCLPLLVKLLSATSTVNLPVIERILVEQGGVERLLDLWCNLFNLVVEP